MKSDTLLEQMGKILFLNYFNFPLKYIYQKNQCSSDYIWHRKFVGEKKTVVKKFLITSLQKNYLLSSTQEKKKIVRLQFEQLLAEQKTTSLVDTNVYPSWQQFTK